jgi:hypothetical protein
MERGEPSALIDLANRRLEWSALHPLGLDDETLQAAGLAE